MSVHIWFKGEAKFVEPGFSTSIMSSFGVPINQDDFNKKVAAVEIAKRNGQWGIFIEDVFHGFDDGHLARRLGEVEPTAQVAFAGHLPFGNYFNCPIQRVHEDSVLREKLMRETDPKDLKRQKVMLAVSVLIESADGQSALVTRRSKHMRTFPHVWVLPGGSFEEDVDADVVQTAIRECQEEVGVTLQPSDLQPFALWESAFPVQVEVGLPVRHHLVVFFRARLPRQAGDAEPRLALQAEEVDAAAWVDTEDLRVALEDVGDLRGRKFAAWEVSPMEGDASREGGSEPVASEAKNSEEVKLVKSKFSLAQLQLHAGRQSEGAGGSSEPDAAPHAGGKGGFSVNSERLSFATAFALSTWLDLRARFGKDFSVAHKPVASSMKTGNREGTPEGEVALTGSSSAL
uniref:Nudix hydrolase domain-containing protein n=1 Tax=Chromera velia CCMP2878 TaxID=1169474 RepID=A0A0G4F760_9ALVE|eukprot:Cvel_15471.t1-p1 / transcript=Cvel_15471.t1 / gene=Cvel_15471 / organism=Chromera_velia_CCMP2878 / gene_product=Nucleoside diphosphate-linked moiety X motif 17, putative / transcript_product=Nucleoside diphosphate-linked moiety X motif 17, putative / location=Cvel_scaffold1147:553-3604(-) / protein_length=401 / sequence_SO=supercontig / SO=protein_coding / is_pseudo=false